MHEENAGMLRVSLKYKKFDKVRGTSSGHSLVTFLQYILQGLGSSFTLSALWALCPNGTDV